jgi:glycosyltransferase involved in cell wall biosynthesis
MNFISVVICTFNRAETLRGTLKRLSAQTLPRDRYEVIVVDDGSSDHTAEVVQEFLKQGSMSLKYLRHERGGPGCAQNHGIRESRGPLVLLLCDDMQPEPDVLDIHCRAHAEHPEPNVVFLGNILQSPDLPDTVFLRNWKPFRYQGLEKHAELTYLHFCGCHASLKRDFILAHGMFVERPAAAFEDVESAWRMYKDGGMRLLYRKDALTYHYHVETIDTACRRAYERGRNFDVLADRVPEPGIFIKNHLVTARTLPLILRGFWAPRPFLLDEDKNVLRYFARETLRRVLFNRLTVPWLFLPLIHRAEHNRLRARLVTPLMLRGVISYHFQKGVRELDRRRAAAKGQCSAVPAASDGAGGSPPPTSVHSEQPG